MTAPPSSKRLLSEAIYEQLMTDEDAPPSVRLQAAQAYDAIENGRPGIARSVTVDDVADLTDDQCERLFRALMRRIDVNPSAFFKTLMREAYVEASQAALPKPNHFKRGKLAGLRGAHIPRWPSPPARPQESMCAALQAELGSEAPAAPAQQDAAVRAAHALSQDAPDEPDARRLASEPPDNVVTLPGVSRPPSVSRIASYQDDATPGGSGRISPDVVARSAFKDPLALDAAFNGFNSRRKRPW